MSITVRVTVSRGRWCVEAAADDFAYREVGRRLLLPRRAGADARLAAALAGTLWAELAGRRPGTRLAALDDGAARPARRRP